MEGVKAQRDGDKFVIQYKLGNRMRSTSMLTLCKAMGRELSAGVDLKTRRSQWEVVANECINTNTGTGMGTIDGYNIS